MAGEERGLYLDFNGGTYNGETSYYKSFYVYDTDIEHRLSTLIGDIIPTHSSPDMEFVGWSTSPDGETISDDNALNYTTLYAIYKNFSHPDEDSFVTYYIYRGGAPYYTATLALGGSYAVDIQNPTRDGYRFLYWEDDSGNTYYYGDIVFMYIPLSGAIGRLYAVWEETPASTSSNIFINVNGKQCAGVSYVKVNGKYKKGIKNYVKVNGVWKTQ